ncbi:hypothetical protein DAPPUDRAFT_310184 [Daphnia pulex]|uniref:Uncharacterized protein n=1 Tax=Daphnia pulex TaxID=6669 RepID=E9FSR9_DAPPU|nr:hypothetical protein DAPPUDRAFT_310184 [Daphnia pulex]|eukprot:EFX89773.1 hypothetical protein DAPPUDRAFT_310184 [Daphnia pulex]
MLNKSVVGVQPRIVWTLDDIKTKELEAMEKKEEENDKWMEFAGRSTCAAVVHLGEKSQPLPVKTVWRITLIIGVILTIASTYFSASSFLSFSGNSEMMLQTNSDSWIEHPNYHICTSNTFNLTILKELGFVDPEMISYLLLTTSLFVVSPALLQNVERQRQLEMKFNKTLEQNGIEDVAEILQRAVLQCEDIIAGCISPSVYIDGADCCKTHFPTGSFASSTGACVTTFSAPPIIQRIPSIGFGFVVLVKDSRDSSALDNSIINPIMANQKGVIFTAADKWTDPMVALFQDRHYTRVGLWTSIAISRTTVNDEEIMQSLISRKICAQRDAQNTFLHLVPGFVNYTENNCVYANRQQRIVEASKCHLYFLPYKGCVSECWRETYQFSTSYADLQLASNFQFGNWTITPDQSKQLAVLNFFYPTFTQNLLVNHYPTINQGLGIVGGNLGLFLGASMVTVIEVVVFVFTYFCPSKWTRH